MKIINPIIKPLVKDIINLSIPFTQPDVIGGLLAWYDASDIFTIIESSNKVSQWADKSGNSKHAIQLTGAAQPTTNASTQNGLNIIDFDGVAEFMSITSFGGNRTVFLVTKGGAITRRAIGANSLSPSWNANDASVQYRAADNTIFRNLDDPGSSANFAVGAVRLNTSTLDLYKNGVVSNQARTLVNNDQFIDTIGRDFAGGDQFFDGSIAEIITYNRGLTDAEIQSINTYLMNKWGIA